MIAYPIDVKIMQHVSIESMIIHVTVHHCLLVNKTTEILKKITIGNSSRKILRDTIELVRKRFESMSE